MNPLPNAIAAAIAISAFDIAKSASGIKGLHANPAVCWMLIGDIETRLDGPGNPVLNLNLEQIGSADALVAIDGNLAALLAATIHLICRGHVITLGKTKQEM